MSRTPGSEVEPLVGNFQHEAHRPRAAEALKSLQKIASVVKPIMRTRNWRVGTLAEFYPPETNLLGLNINRGQKICIRLRYPGDANQFLPFEEVVDTMMHELCHIVHGPHDQAFHALWDQLRDEHENLLRKGYTGEGFLGRGDRLGGARIPKHEAKRRARTAAEKRRALTAGSGQKLGGATVARGTDIRSVIVAAIERRNKIEKGCASGTDQGRQLAQSEAIKKEGEDVTTTRAVNNADEDVMMQAYIDLIQEEDREKYGDSYLPPTETNPAGMRATPPAPSVCPSKLREQQASIEAAILKKDVPPSIPTDTKPAPSRGTEHTPLLSTSTKSTRFNTPTSRPEPSNPKPKPPASTPQSTTWPCEICTLVNPIALPRCDACESPRPSQFSPPTTSSNPSAKSKYTSSAAQPRLSSTDQWAKLRDQELARTQAKPVGWQCRGCGNFVENEWWTCASCGRMRESS